MKKVNVLQLIASICLLIGSIINLLNLLIEIPFAIYVCTVPLLLISVILFVIVMMKRILLIFAAVILMALSATAQTRPGTLGAEMEFMHGHYGVNFIYDSTIPVDVAYSGSSIREAADMDECLQTLFEGSGIKTLGEYRRPADDVLTSRELFGVAV